jgi:hypothetical protein
VAIKGNLKHANIGKNQHFRIDLRLLFRFGMGCCWLHYLVNEKQSGYQTSIIEKKSH